jgi:type I restriction enzyme S subunit
MKESFWAGGHCYIVKPIIDTCKDFLYYVLKYREPDIMKLRVGSGLPNIQRKTLLKETALQFPPTIAEQSAIAAVLSGMDTEIAALEQKRDKYIAIKQGMMQNLLTGKIRLI